MLRQFHQDFSIACGDYSEVRPFEELGSNVT
jgi:hypothetical protein